MKDIGRKIEDIFTEVAFAEERDIRHRNHISGRYAERFDALFTAITFAEAGEFNSARRSIGGGMGNSKRHVKRQLQRFCAGRA